MASLLDSPVLADLKAYRGAHHPLSRPPVNVDFREVYHALCPLPSLSPVPRDDDPITISDQRENEAAYRQLLVHAVLAILLPTEDLENPCLTSLVEQILSELIIGNVIANKAAQPWMLLEGICIAARVLGEKKAEATERIVSTSHLATGPDVTTPVKRRQWSARGLVLLAIRLTILAISSIRFVITTLVMSSSLPPRRCPLDDSDASPTDEKFPLHHSPSRPAQTPMLALAIWSCLANVIELSCRMPWLSGFLSWLQLAAISGLGMIAALNSPLDRSVISSFLPLLSGPVRRSV